MTSGPGSGARNGGIAMATFGLAWWAVASADLPSSAKLAWILGGAAVTLVLVVMVLRRLRNDGSEDLDRHHRGFAMLGLTQWLAIVAVVVGCVVTDHQLLIAALVSVVVGVHFLPLSWMYRWRGYALLGLALVVVGAAATAVLLATDPSIARALTTTAVPVAVLLWVAAVSLVGSARTPAVTPAR